MKAVRYKIIFPLISSLVLTVMVFPFGAQAWYNSNYQYCREFTYTAGGNSGGVATTTTHAFPLVATSTISSLAATTSGGRIYETGSNNHGTTTPIDVIFTDGSDCNSDAGSAIPFYFEKYVSTTGEFVAWVEPPTVSSTSADSILMYYGYADNTATDQSDEAGVFNDLGEVGVWSLSDGDIDGGAGDIKDSTSLNHDGTTQNMDTSNWVAGYLGGAFNFTDVGGVELVSVADSTDFEFGNTTTDGEPFTIIAWIYPEDATTFRVIGKDGTDREWSLTTSGSDVLLGAVLDDSASAFRQRSAPAPTENTWNHLTYTYDGSASSAGIDLYKNGAIADDTDVNGVNPYIAMEPGGQPVRIGSTSGSDSAEGYIDDVRVFARLLHAMDILTIFNNAVNSATFWTIGNEETEDAGAVAPTVGTGFASNVNTTTATLNGAIFNTGGANATQHGFAYGTDSTLATVIATSTLGAFTGTGEFSTGISSLSSGTTYYFRAYATNTGGTGYGSIRSFVAGNANTPRRLRLFEGFTVRFIDGRIILHQQ